MQSPSVPPSLVRRPLSCVCICGVRFFLSRDLHFLASLSVFSRYSVSSMMAPPEVALRVTGGRSQGTRRSRDQRTRGFRGPGVSEVEGFQRSRGPEVQGAHSPGNRGPGDQKTRGPEAQRTQRSRKPTAQETEVQGTRGPEDQRTQRSRGPGGSGGLEV